MNWKESENISQTIQLTGYLKRAILKIYTDNCILHFILETQDFASLCVPCVLVLGRDWRWGMINIERINLRKK
jgi:hypothetical protein